MNIKLPVTFFCGLAFLVGIFVAFTSKTYAVSIAEQTQSYNSGLNVWQAIQELGSDLSGTAEKFTFRVSAAAANINQFDFTAQNSRIYDKTTNTYIGGCAPIGSNPADRLRGLFFETASAPVGFEDVTIDFSCRNYTFVAGHKYLILLTNANMAQFGGMRMRLASAGYSGTSNDFFTGGGLRYAYDAGFCNAGQYIWNSQTSNSGCNVFSTAKDDLYFVLTNNTPPPPPPRLPVIFIPGIGGSEMKTSQDIIWSKEDGHGGTYSHAYAGGEKIWVNQDEAVKLGDDDYFDILRLKPDGVTSEASLALTGDLTSFGYSDIDSFFTGMGYTKGTNFFIYPYDWRKDVRTTKDDLDALIELAKQKSGQAKVNLVVHSMGGLIARYYISDSNKAVSINKLIELGVPHLGAVDSLKTLMYGTPLGKPIFKIFNIGIAATESKDVFQNLPSAFQLLPSTQYYNFYNNNTDNPSPFRDDRDIDNNKITGDLNYDQTKNLLSNLSYNMTVFGLGEQFHNSLDPIFSQTNGTKVYEIVGSSQPTLGQIHETWWITWPINLIPKTDEIFINGDATVPLYSASLKNDSLDISGAAKIYYVEQEHSDLVSSNGPAMQTVKSILNDDNTLPVEVKDQKISLEGEQLSLDDGELDLYDDQNRHCGLNNNGEMEENIPDVRCTTSGKVKQTFIKKKASKVKVTVTRKSPNNNSKTTNLKKRTYKQDKISKTTLYKDLLIDEKSQIIFDLDPASDTNPILSDGTQTISATSEITGTAASDQSPPTTSIQIPGAKDASGTYSGPVTITLIGNDLGSGILKIEYSLDNGQTVQVYSEPFTISTPGKTTIQFRSIDQLGNEEIPQSITIEIAISPTPSPTPAASSGSSSSSSSTNSSTETQNTSEVKLISTNSTTPSQNSIYSAPAILGIEFEKPHHIADQINISNIFNKQADTTVNKTIANPADQILGGLLIVSGGIVALASLGLLATFLKPFPK